MVTPLRLDSSSAFYCDAHGGRLRQESDRHAPEAGRDDVSPLPRSGTPPPSPPGPRGGVRGASGTRGIRARIARDRVLARASNQPCSAPQHHGASAATTSATSHTGTSCTCLVHVTEP